MNIALLGLNSNLVNLKDHEKIINYLKNNILKLGEDASLVSYCNNSFESIKDIINKNYNLVFCVGSTNSIYNYNIKENFAKLLGKKLEKNSNCELMLKKYCSDHSINFGSSEEMEIHGIVDSIILCDSKFYHNGFMYKYNNCYIVFVPSDLLFVQKMYNSFILPFINGVVSNNQELVVLRCYGILEKDIKSIINFENYANELNIRIISSNLDNMLYMSYSPSTSQNVQAYIAEICSKLSKFIYSTEDTNLYETAINLLKIQKKKLVIAETMTYGNTILNLSKCDNNVIENGLVFNNYDSMMHALKLDKRVVEMFGKYSVNTVYELDNLLLQSHSADIAIFLLGDRSSDQCFIAIGDIDGIHVYKNKILNFDENLINSLSETTMFYLIKKLRQNDLQFI